MKSKGLNAFKWLIFIFGLCIIGLAYYFYGYGKNLSNAKIYLWVNILVIYITFFFPVFLYGITFKNFDKNAPAIVLILRADIFFCIISLVLSIAVIFAYIALKTAILIQCGVLFFSIISVFIAFLTTSHISNVEQSERRHMSLIKEIRSSMEMAALRVGSLPASCTEEKNKIIAFAEEVKYISPVADTSAYALEEKILMTISQTADACMSVMAGSDAAELKKHITVLEMLIRERKLKRN